jgi:hypothetical protein
MSAKQRHMHTGWKVNIWMYFTLWELKSYMYLPEIVLDYEQK